MTPPPDCVFDTDRLCIWSENDCGVEGGRSTEPIVLGPVLDPTLAVPLPFSFVAHAPPPIIPPDFELAPHDSSIGSILIDQLFDEAENRPVVGASVTVSQSGPSPIPPRVCTQGDDPENDESCTGSPCELETNA